VLIAHERTGRNGPDYLPMLKQDILNVIKKYVSVGEDQVSVQLDTQENCDVLELNITLPEASESKAKSKESVLDPEPEPTLKPIRNAGSLAAAGDKSAKSAKNNRSQSKVT